MGVRGSGAVWRCWAGVAAASAVLLSAGVVPSAWAGDGGGDAAGARASVSFVDVDGSTPHAGDIAWLASSGVSAGWARADGRREFRPTLSVTRQDMAAFLYRVAGSPAFDAGKAKNPFRDVDASTPHYREVLWLASSGISTGWPDGTFRGMESVKRQDMAAFLHRLADLEKASPRLGDAVSFKDVTKDTPHSEDIIWLARTGVTTGWRDGSFRGMKAVVRQDMGAFLRRVHDNVLNAKTDGDTNKPGTPSNPSEQGKPSVPDSLKSKVREAGDDWAITQDGSLWTWGDNGVGQVGDGTTKDRLTPYKVPGLTDVKQAGTDGASFAVTGDGSLWTWGYNFYGGVGDGTTKNRLTPYKVPGLAGVKQVDGDGRTSFAVTGDGSLWTWGDNYLGSVGDGTTETRLTPYKVPGLTGVKQAGSNGGTSFAVTGDGSLWTWGDNNSGQVGDGTTKDRLTPYKVPGLTDVKQAGSNVYTSFAVTGDGSLWTWGRNDSGQVGDGTTETRLTPYKVPGLTGVKQFSSAGGVSFAVMGDGSLWTWGDNSLGSVGDGMTKDRLTPYKVPGLTDVKQAGSGNYNTSFAVTGDGSLWTWGLNAPDGTGKDHLTPYKVPGLTGVKQFSSAGGVSFAVTGDGSLWTWGDNRYGQIGDGTTKNRFTPYKVPGLTGVKQFRSIGGITSFAVTGDGSLWTWGWNDSGRVGDGTTKNRLTPYKVQFK